MTGNTQKTEGLSILHKYLIITVSLLLAGLASLSISYLFNVKKVIRTEGAIMLRTLASNLSTNCKEMIIAWDYPLLKEVCTDVLKEEDISYISIYDDTGSIIGDSDYSRIGSDETVLYQSIIGYDYTGIDPYTGNPKGNFYTLKGEYNGKDSMEIRGRLMIGNRVIGALLLGASRDRVKRVISAINAQIIVISVLILGLGVVVAFFFVRTLTRPIGLLHSGAQKIGAGNLEYRIDVKTKDETGMLADAFNDMARRLLDMIVHEKELTRQVAESKLRAEYADILEKKNKQLQESYNELKDMQKQLVQSEKMATLGTLAGGIAHEINNPLGTILANTQMLLREIKEADFVESLDLIEDSTRKCKTIANTLLKYTRKSGPSDIEAVSLNNVCENVVSILGNQFEIDGITIETIYQKIPPVYCNVNEIEQVVTNILINAKDAVKKSKKTGNIIIKTFIRENMSVISIEDNGCGMKEDIISKIFDPFFTTKDIGSGTGLGLSVSYGIIQRHKGRILVNSRFDSGTIFELELPIKSQNRLKNLL